MLNAKTSLSSLNRRAAEFAASFDAFLYEFGSRGPNEWESRSPSWEKALGWIKDDTHFAPDARCDRLFKIVMEMAYDAELSPDRTFAVPGKS